MIGDRDTVRLSRYFEVLVASSAGIPEHKTPYDGDLLGRTLDTFVAAQLRTELAGSGTRARESHRRTKGGGEEVDFVIEFPGRREFAGQSCRCS